MQAANGKPCKKHSVLLVDASLLQGAGRQRPRRIAKAVLLLTLHSLEVTRCLLHVYEH